MKHDDHHCQALVLLCIDFRFWQATLRFVKNQLKIKSFDILALAGGAKSLACLAVRRASSTKKIYQRTVLDNIKISIQLHQIKKIILVNHQDCGAYGGSQQFKSLKKEITFHQKELQKARRLLKRLYPRLRVINVFVNFQNVTIVRNRSNL